MSAYIIDIDGTLTTSGDTPREPLIARMRAMAENGDRFLIVSSRTVDRMDDTRAWLRANGVPFDELHLNDFADRTGPNVALAFKEYKYSLLIEEYGDQLESAVDNDAGVRQMARRLGLQALTAEEFLTDTDEVRAVYRGEPIDLQPTSAMRAEAQRGLDWREQFGRGGTGVAVRRARQILSGDEMTPETIITMAAWFARHEVDKEGQGYRPDEDGYPSAGRIAWALWGGDPGQSWSIRKREEMMRIDDALDVARSATSAGREIKAVACSYKALEADRTFEGYGSVFGVVDSYGDVVMPGAFADTIRKAEGSGRMPAMLWQHDPSQVVGVWRTMREDARGLHVVGELADTQLGREAYALLKMGALSGLSIGYSVSSERYDRERDVRELVGIELWETSLVTFPANTDARVAAVKDARSGSYRGLERILREAGFSRSEAKAVATAGMRALREASAPDLTADEAAALCRRFNP